MRTLAITQNVTVDGSIEMLGDWFEPQGQAGVDNSDLLEELHRQDGEADALLVGWQTFEDLRGYWPTVVEDATGIAEYLNRVHKYVVSGTMTDPQWQNSTILSGDIVEQVRSLKEQPGKDIVVTGSIRLCHALIEAGLVDEYRLFVYPVVQGRGRRLFPDGLRATGAAPARRDVLPQRHHLLALRAGLMPSTRRAARRFGRLSRQLTRWVGPPAGRSLTYPARGVGNVWGSEPVPADDDVLGALLGRSRAPTA